MVQIWLVIFKNRAKITARVTKLRVRANFRVRIGDVPPFLILVQPM